MQPLSQATAFKKTYFQGQHTYRIYFNFNPKN